MGDIFHPQRRRCAFVNIGAHWDRVERAMREWIVEHKNTILTSVISTALIGVITWGGSQLLKLTGVLAEGLTLDGVLNFATRLRTLLVIDTHAPAWAVLIGLASILTLTCCLLRLRHAAQRLAVKVSTLAAEIQELNNPSNPDLTYDQLHVLFWVAAFHDHRSGITSAEIASLTNSDVFVIDAIADKLKAIDILAKKRLLADPLSLTAKGRQYMTRSEVLAQFDTFKQSKGASKLGQIH